MSWETSNRQRFWKVLFGSSIALWVLLCVAVNVAIVLVAFHFIEKYW